MAKQSSALEKMVMNVNFWQGKKVLVTGHTGFKGSWLCLWLQKLGAEITGFSLNIPSQPSLYEQAQVAENMTCIMGDIRNISHLKAIFTQAQPEIVFHLAAQSLVRESYQDPIETYSTNVMGTLNVLEAIKETSSVKSVVMVSTDKCYENKESTTGYTEEDNLGGFDPYSSSKACLELLVASYRQSFFGDENSQVYIATARAGNVIGGGDYAKDRLIPDLIKSIRQNENIELRYPQAIRPWQHVLEPLSGYLLLGEKLFLGEKRYAQAWNFGPEHSNLESVNWVSNYFIQLFNTSIKTVELTNPQLYETSCLTLNAQKAKDELNWHPVWGIEETLQKIYEWEANANYSYQAKCYGQIADYSQRLTQIC